VSKGLPFWAAQRIETETLKPKDDERLYRKAGKKAAGRHYGLGAGFALPALSEELSGEEAPGLQLPRTAAPMHAAGLSPDNSRPECRNGGKGDGRWAMGDGRWAMPIKSIGPSTDRLMSVNIPA